MIKLLKGERLAKTANSLFFYKKRRATIGQARTPYDILFRNAGKQGRWNVAVKPLVVGLCPSDMAGGMLEFPPSRTRSLSDPKNPAVAGHEFVGRVIAASKTACGELRRRGISLGDLVAGDINVGCGFCSQCKRGDPAVYCLQGATFAGVGSSPHGADWVQRQTGRPHVPGAYTEGFIVLPASNVHKVPRQAVKNVKALALFCQADAVACAKTSCNIMGLVTFKQMRGFDNPSVLVIGAGRLGTWHIAVIKDILPNARIFVADIKQANLKSIASLFGISKNRQYYVRGKHSFLRRHIENVFGKNKFFDFIIDTAGHGVLTGRAITDMILLNVAPGGRFWTTSHTGIPGVDAGHPMILLGSKSFGNGLSPQNNFPYAVDFLAKYAKQYIHCLAELPNGLADKRLARIVATGGSGHKRKESGIILYSIVNQPNL